MFYRSGLMEAWGRGITRIFSECESAGMPKPIFRVDPYFVTLIVQFKDSLSPRKEDGTINDTLNDTFYYAYIDGAYRLITMKSKGDN